jgi:hypothetical protein
MFVNIRADKLQLFFQAKTAISPKNKASVEPQPQNGRRLMTRIA